MKHKQVNNNKEKKSMKQLKELILGTTIMTMPIILSIACGIIFNFLNW